MNKKIKENVAQLEPSNIIVKKALDEDEKYLLSFTSDKFFIWKTENGIIGFSNIKYPNLENLTMFKDQNWIEYRANENTKIIK